MKYFLFVLICFVALQVIAQQNCADLIQNYSGFCEEYHSNGKVAWLKEYKDGKAVGMWKFYNENGELSREIAAATINDSLIKLEKEKITNSQHSQNSSHENVLDEMVINEIKTDKVPLNEINNQSMGDTSIFVEVDPKFRGDMSAWIEKKFRYPEDAEIKGLQGKCYAKFVVEKNGKVSNISIVKGVPNCSSCDEEVIRVIGLMPKWEAGKIKGKKVRAWVYLPFNFVLQ